VQARSATTFLFTDIEGSTGLWERDPERMRPALARHDAIARTAVERNNGIVVKMIGDGMHAAFDDPLAALNATLAIQSELADESKTHGVALRVRCGLHIGVAERRDNDYFGSPVNRAARIMSAAHGGQVLLSQAVADCVRERLPAVLSLRDLGGVRLKDLASPEHIYQLVHPHLRQEFPALRSLEATPNNLPQQVTTFIGREGELFEIKRLLKQCRLVTITGSGGIGKTRLALQVAADNLDAYPDGVWLVELGSISDPMLVPTSVAQVLAVQELARAPLTQTLCGHLKSRCLLLVLDNCEHLIKGCAELAGTLLAAAPDIRIVASSREPLQVAGEQNFPLRPLSLPEADARPETLARAEAVQLFVERVRSQQPGFVLTERQAPAVAKLCAHLDGIPLALELAAARVRLLSIEEINARLNDRFKLLTGGIRTALPRQQTLRATLDWSYELLAEQERTLLNRMAMFPGGFTLEAAASVAADEAMDEFVVIDLLSQLVARSLVVADAHASGTRYRLLETTRAYALEKLAETGQTAAIARRHAQYFRDLFERASDDWLRMSDKAWRATYVPELDNIRAALDWAAHGPDGDSAIGGALAGASGGIWVGLSLTSEGRQRLEAAVARVGEQTPALHRARLWLWLGQLWGQTAPVQAVAALERAIDLYRGLSDALGIGYSLVRLGGRLAVMGRFEQAARILAEALPVLEHASVPKALASYFREFGFLKMLTGDAVSARTQFEKALSLYRGAGAEHFALITTGNLADVAWALGDLDAALSGFRETVALMRNTPTTTRSSLGANLTNLAGVLTERGELNEALVPAREGLSLLKEGGYAWLFADHAALRAALAGKVANAARVAGFVDAAHSAKEASRQPNELRARERLQTLLGEKLSSDELLRLLAEGAQLSEDEACRLALEE
jgi:predicted ATPase/class 3 adenylate cyclase